MKVVGVPYFAVDTAWPLVSRYLREAMKTGTRDYCSLDWIKDQIKSRHQQLWVIQKDGKVVAACVTMIKPHEKMKEFDILLVGGKGMDEWQDVWWKQMIEYAKDKGCSRMRGYGRRGWIREIGKRCPVTVDYSFWVEV